MKSLLLPLSLVISHAAGFTIYSHPSIAQYASSSQLFSTPQKRVARRHLKKRSRRKRDGQSKAISSGGQSLAVNSFASQTMQSVETEMEVETRPLVRSRSVEAGEDYWIDEEEMKKSLERKHAIKNRQSMEGEISQQKLRDEVVAPYKQNWIGYFSVFIVVLATIVTQFPELLNTPLIPIPDL
mmetsp:Transcript_2399/g.3583  ORF Transcript_2399/g.3583 Transcript_2399/m.3583 type:complete len:183 (-) Transcript_2399:287-835(-)|eukprot:CAMPEP_0194081462 /NCGR_PEP_ID=MMETSP0149-20130528/7235_1 /TAXON_ID=122233 /ORGANISM="Chaetoceros debilis, Strain MM31A-1" /LENGTH=182 /DNA_ID=CAMNT_0038763389 /DNA_START=172 /DNA_END=720 /DNA_ORIENTATION=+